MSDLEIGILLSLSKSHHNFARRAVSRLCDRWALSMIDPFTALAAVKSAVSAGQELINVTRQIGEFFDGVDDLRAAHEKKKNSLFSG